MKPLDGNNNSISKLTRRGFLGASAGIGSLALANNKLFAETISSVYPARQIDEIHGWGSRPGMVSIGFNENPYGPSPRAIRAVTDSIMDVNRYDFVAYTNLENAIGDHLGLEKDPNPAFGANPLFGKSLYPVYVEGGSSFILNQVTMLYGVKNGAGEIIEIDPGYGGVTRAAMSLRSQFGAEIKIKRIPTTSKFVHDLKAMEEAITDNTTLVVITNPNNPTGTLLSYQELERFINNIPRHVTLLIDEAYIDFVREDNYETGISLALKYNNVIVTRTFSKMYGLAAMRIGYAVASKSIISDLRASGNSWGLPSINCYAAAAALKDLSFTRQVKRLTGETKDYFYRELDILGLNYIPSHSSFVLVNIEEDAQAFQKKLMEKNVRVRAYDNDAIKNYIRVTLGTLDEMQVTVDVIKEELKA